MSQRPGVMIVYASSYGSVSWDDLLQRSADLPTELPSAVRGVDHLPGVALRPGWGQKRTHGDRYHPERQLDV